MNDELDQMIRRYGDEIGRAQRRQQARRRLPVRRIAIAGAAAGLALGVTVAALPGPGPADAVAQARAALNPKGQIIHMVTEQRLNIPGYNQVTRSESWVADDRERIVSGGVESAGKWDPSRRITVRIGDQRVRVIPGRFEQYNRRTNQYRWYRGFRGPGPSPQQDPVKEVRDLLARGDLEDAGTMTVNGREVRRLVTRPGQHTTTVVDGRTVQAPVFQAEYRVDAKTFEPVEFRVAEETRVTKLFERLPRNAETEQLLRIDVPAGAERKMLR